MFPSPARTASRTWRWALHALLLFVTAAIDRPADGHRHAPAGLALAVACAALAAESLRARNPAVRYATALVCFSSLVVSAGFRAANGVGFSTPTARAIFSDGHLAGDALSLYLRPALVAALAALAAVRLAWVLAGRARATHPGARRAPALALALLTLTAAVTAAGAADRLPSLVRVPAVLARTALVPLYEGPREAPALTPRGPRRARHVVLIVDESVRGDLLSLDGYALPTTPWLRSRASRLANFGVAASGTNCSRGANASLLAGLRPGDVPDRADRLRRAPTLFGYARRAGYAPVLVDAQSTTAAPPHELTAEDLRGLARHEVVRRRHPSAPAYALDDLAADVVEEVTRPAAAPGFVYVNKAGAHFRWERAYPPAARAFDAAAAGGGARAAERARYLDALRWTVDGFFARLLPRLEGRDVLVLYTSDHGESVYDDGRAVGHCAEAGAPREQARVPMFAWAGREGAAFGEARLAAGRYAGRASHAQVFPTLLDWMGYAPAEVARRYGPSLTGAPPPRSFVTGDLRGEGVWARVRVP